LQEELPTNLYMLWRSGVPHGDRDKKNGKEKKRDSRGSPSVIPLNFLCGRYREVGSRIPLPATKNHEYAGRTIEVGQRNHAKNFCYGAGRKGGLHLRNENMRRGKTVWAGP